MGVRSLHLIILLGFCAFLLAPRMAQANAWSDFKDTFISPDGRVIDYCQKQISHSEGQAYGMLLAVVNNDQELFEKLWSWSKKNLQVRGNDNLLCWSWGRRPNGQWQVLEYNNASDGDLLSTFALLLAAEKWGKKEYHEEATKIAKSLVNDLLLRRDGRWFLLPGYRGFVHKDQLDLNPSYLIFSAFKKCSALEGPWTELIQDSRRLLKKSLFSPLKLPADWVRYESGVVQLHPERGERFGYDAIRVPLYLAWEGMLKELPKWNNVLTLVDTLGYVPKYFDLKNVSVALDPAEAGFYAVFARTAFELGREKLGRQLMDEARKKLTSEPKNYYSHALFLLANAHLKGS